MDSHEFCKAAVFSVTIDLANMSAFLGPRHRAGRLLQLGGRSDDAWSAGGTDRETTRDRMETSLGAAGTQRRVCPGVRVQEQGEDTGRTRVTGVPPTLSHWAPRSEGPHVQSMLCGHHLEVLSF